MKGRTVPARADTACRHLWMVTESGCYACVRCGCEVIEVWGPQGLRLDVYAPVKLSRVETQRAGREVLELLAG